MPVILRLHLHVYFSALMFNGVGISPEVLIDECYADQGSLLPRFGARGKENE